jgi:hypothetical protein
MLYDEAVSMINPDFAIGAKDESYVAPTKVRTRIDNIVKVLKGKDLMKFNLPYIKPEIDRFIKSNPDPDLEISSNIYIELCERLIYAYGKQITVNDKLIIAYLTIYCSI